MNHIDAAYLKHASDAIVAVLKPCIKKDISIYKGTSSAVLSDLCLQLAHDMLEKGVTPTDFSAVIEFSLLDEATRKETGSHFTAPVIAHQLIDPLFLTELETELADIKKTRDKTERWVKLDEYRTRLGEQPFLDPACGAGNILIETYLSMRKLDIEALRAMLTLDPTTPVSTTMAIGNYRGIEINRKSACMAELLLTASAFYMDAYQRRVTGIDGTEPIMERARITVADALATDWDTVLPSGHHPAPIVVENPPFIGHQNQNDDQKTAMQTTLDGLKDSNGNGMYDPRMDFSSAFLLKTSRYLTDQYGRPVGKWGCITSANIAYGCQQSLVFPKVLDAGWHQKFTWKPFTWHSEQDSMKAVLEKAKTGSATREADVTVLLNGFSADPCDSRAFQITDAYTGIRRDVTSQPATMMELIGKSGKRCAKVSFSGHAGPNRIVTATKKKLSADLADLLTAKPQQGDLTAPLCIPKHSNQDCRWMPVYAEYRDVKSSSYVFCDDPTGLTFAIASSHAFQLWREHNCTRSLGDRCEITKTMTWNTFPMNKLERKDRKRLINAGKKVLAARTSLLSGNDYKDVASMYRKSTPDALRKAHEGLDRVMNDILTGNRDADDAALYDAMWEWYGKLTGTDNRQVAAEPSDIKAMQQPSSAVMQALAQACKRTSTHACKHAPMPSKNDANTVDTVKACPVADKPACKPVLTVPGDHSEERELTDLILNGKDTAACEDRIYEDELARLKAQYDIRLDRKRRRAGATAKASALIAERRKQARQAALKAYIEACRAEGLDPDDPGDLR